MIDHTDVLKQYSYSLQNIYCDATLIVSVADLRLGVCVQCLLRFTCASDVSADIAMPPPPTLQAA